MFLAMKKHILLLLVTLLPLATFAQRFSGDIFPAGNYVYRVTATMDGVNPGKVSIIGIYNGQTPVVDGALVIPNEIRVELFGDTYTFSVTALATDALQMCMDASGAVQENFTETADAKRVTFPATIKALPTNCLKGYTNINSISFATGSELETIASGAFATTQVRTFDFSNCSQLTELTNAVFVEAAPAVNSYIESITLPESSVSLTHIGTAFQRLTGLREIRNLEKSAITEVVAQAFSGDAKLTKLELPGTVETIAAGAFENSGIEALTIDVTSITGIGNGTGNVYGTSTASKQKLRNLVLKGNLGGVVRTGAFKDCTSLETLTLDGLSFVSGGKLANGSFEGCTKIAEVRIKSISGTPATGHTIDAEAFKGCTALAKVEIGGISSTRAVGTRAFGERLKTVTIGTVEAGATAIASGAFCFQNAQNSSLNLAVGAGEYLSANEVSAPVIAAGAFDFTAVNGGAGWATGDFPAVNIGRIHSSGGVFAQGAVKGNSIYAINFKGDIAGNGIDKRPISDNTGATSVAALKLRTLNFEGRIGTGGIAANAFASLPQAMTLNFDGELAGKAVAAGAFQGMKAGSVINYNCTAIADVSVNPFDRKAFSTAATFATGRDIVINVKNTELYGNYHGNHDGSGIAIADGDFDIYRVKFYVAPVTPVVDKTFIAYRNEHDKGVAWARLHQLGAKGVGTIADGSNLQVRRIQNLDGGKVKVTLYGTYTDEDDTQNASTIYMVPLRVVNGCYEISGANTETVIARVEKKGADITDANKNLKVNVTDIPAVISNSWWGGLTNTKLDVAQNIMTNKQLIEGNAKNGSTPVSIAGKDLYIMSNPAAYHGFYISKTEVTSTNNAYINTGWYYMLLKHYNDAPAAARVIWMSDDDADAIFNVKAEELKPVAEGWYTVDGKKLNAAPATKGLYIRNGKKIVVK